MSDDNEWDDEDEPRGRQTFVDGRVLVRKRQCDTCIFRPGNKMQLNEGRVEQMTSECDETGGVIPCHKHLDEDLNPVCRGYYDRGSNFPLRLATAMELIDFV